MSLKALIWDVDGTLAETERDGHRVAFNLAFEAFGLDWHWDEARYGDLLRVAGGRERLLLDMSTQPDAPPAHERVALAAALHASKNAHYAQLISAGSIGLRPGVRELIDECTRAGLPMAIATTTSRSNVVALCAATLGVTGLRRFDAVLCAEDAPSKKPDPQVYLRCLQRLGLNACDTLAIEDAPAGVAACTAASVPVLVTRSHYFPAAAVPGALAVGPGLDDVAAWSLPACDGGRVTLAQLTAWWRSSVNAT